MSWTLRCEPEEKGDVVVGERGDGIMSMTIHDHARPYTTVHV